MTDMGVVDLPEPRIGPASRLAPKPIKFVLNWGRRYSLWVFNFGLACCAIEFIATSMSRHDFIRLGVIPFAPGPRQADLMVVSGTVSDKMAPAVKRLYEQMPEPKYVISFGACSNCGGPYWDSYCVTKGVDQIIPVDVYVPGCPPRPEALLHGIIRLQEKIAAESLGERYTREGEPVTPPPAAVRKERTPAVLRRPLVLPPIPEPAEIEAAEQPTQSIPIPGETDTVRTHEFTPVEEAPPPAAPRTREVPPAEDAAGAVSPTEETQRLSPVEDTGPAADTQRLTPVEDTGPAEETREIAPVEDAGPAAETQRFAPVEETPAERTRELPPAERGVPPAEDASHEASPEATRERPPAEKRKSRRRGGRLRRFAEPPPVDAVDDPDIIPGLSDDD
jgi:NADH-quinone oxidoreductase B subunit